MDGVYDTMYLFHMHTCGYYYYCYYYYYTAVTTAVVVVYV